MSIRLSLAGMVAAALSVTACTTSSTSTDIEPMAGSEANSAPVASNLSTPAGIDASAETQWYSVEKLWPEHPYMGVVNSSMPDDDSYGLSFVCNTDTGKLTGILEFQPAALAGQSGVFGLTTSDGVVKDLDGAYRLGEDGGSEFVFPIDWLTIKAMTEAGRTDIVSPTGSSEIAIATADYTMRGDTRILVSAEGFEEHQAQLYYYCNPK